MSESAATMTTAASAVCGRSASSELRNRSSTATSPAPTTPVSWLFAPDCSATAVREPLVEIANPWKSPAAMFAAPMPTISWSGSTSSPRRAAKLVAVAIVSVSETSVMPNAAIEQRHDVARLRSTGCSASGRPAAARRPCRRPRPPGRAAADSAVAPTTATRMAGIRVVTRGRSSRTASTDRPTSSVVVFVWSRPSTNALTSSRKPSASVENPKSFGSWPTMIVIARPFM